MVILHVDVMVEYKLIFGSVEHTPGPGCPMPPVGPPRPGIPRSPCGMGVWSVESKPCQIYYIDTIINYPPIFPPGHPYIESTTVLSDTLITHKM